MLKKQSVLLVLLLLSFFLLSACGGGTSVSNVDDSASRPKDIDNDGILDNKDNCPADANSDQKDSDNDGIGDACDQTVNGDLEETNEPSTDSDQDGILNSNDNCPQLANVDQLDTDNDNQGNICDTDDDNDGVVDSRDDFPLDKSKATTVNQAFRLLVQASFGPTEHEIDSIVSTGIDAWIEQQLEMPSAYDNVSDNHKTHLQRTIEIAHLAEPSQRWVSQNGIFNEGLSRGTVKDYQMSAWWENALGHPTNQRHGSDQLRQRVAYALSQLLVTSAQDPRLSKRGESLAYFNDILTKHAFGNYRTLIGEVSRSATMGVYLSHQGNKKSNKADAIRQDENFARELIQLFTIGLYELNLDSSPNRDGNSYSYPDAGSHTVASYAQEDVEELAKVMTGWDLKGNDNYGGTKARDANYARTMEFFPYFHEDEIEEGGDGKVTLLGTSFDLNSGDDQSGMDSALDILFAHSNMGPYVSRHLIMNLVTSNPSSAYVARVATIFNDNGQGIKGDLKAVVRAILNDQDARDSINHSAPNFGKIKEPLLAWTQLLRTFNVKPLDGWKSVEKNSAGERILVNGVYVYRSPETAFGQAPLRSKSVFNFYMPDYVPSDTYFSENRLVAPESQIQTDQALIEFNNVVYKFLSRHEKNKIERLDNKTLQDFAKERSHYSSYVMLVDFDRELALFEKALDGDNNGDFINMDEINPNDNKRYKEKAVATLLNHLDKIMLGNSMTTSYKAILQDYLMNANGLKSSNKLKQAQHMIRDAVRFITTSSAFMVQK